MEMELIPCYVPPQRDNPFEKFPKLREMAPCMKEFETVFLTRIAPGGVGKMIALYAIADAKTGEPAGLIGSQISDMHVFRPKANMMIHWLFREHGTKENLRSSFRKLVQNLVKLAPNLVEIRDYVSMGNSAKAQAALRHMRLLGFVFDGDPVTHKFIHPTNGKGIDDMCQAMKYSLIPRS